jgi:hypothetical protein
MLGRWAYPKGTLRNQDSSRKGGGPKDEGGSSDENRLTRINARNP